MHTCSTSFSLAPASYVGFCRRPLTTRSSPLRQQTQRKSRQQSQSARADLQIDWSSPEALVSVAGAVLGVGLGIGVPIFYISRDTADEEKLSELRELNRKTFKETGEYMTEDQIREFRKPRWTDRREFQDDD